MKAISAFLLKIMGWKILGDYPHHEKKLVIIVLHHTSNWDFPLGLLLRKAAGFSANFVMKSTLFIGPLARLFRWLGGYPVERDPMKKKFSMVESITKLYKNEEKLTITFTPEGTRSKVRTLKTGSWLIAKNADVPILYIEFDFSRKHFRIDKVHKACPTFEQEYKMMKAYFKDSKGFNKELSFDFKDNDMTFKQ